MQIEEIQAFIKKQLKTNIDLVLSGQSSSEKLMYARPNDVISYLGSINIPVDDELDTNGWQWEYWIKFRYNGQNYIVYGDGYYSDHATIAVDLDAYADEILEDDEELDLDDKD